jgi:SSS family solute:Na+ symporter
MDNKDNKDNKDELKVEWFGIDGALVLLFIFLACLYGYGIINRIDFIIGIIAPGIAITMTVGVFIKYCTEVFSFATGKKSKK